MAKNFRGLLFFAAPCSHYHWNSVGIHTQKLLSPLCVMPSFIVLLYKAQIPSRQLCDKVRDKFQIKSRTQIMKVRDTNHVVDFRDLCSRQSPPTFPVHCNGLNFIRATQTGLSRTCHGLYRKHLDMSRWFVSTTFPARKFR